MINSDIQFSRKKLKRIFLIMKEKSCFFLRKEKQAHYCLQADFALKTNQYIILLRSAFMSLTGYIALLLDIDESQFLCVFFSVFFLFFPLLTFW